MATRDDEIRRNPEVAARKTPRGVILARLGDGECFEVNRVGAAFWAAIEGPRPFSEICDELSRGFGVEAAVVERDLGNLVEALARAGLVFVAPSR